MSWQETEKEIRAFGNNGLVLDELCRLLKAEKAIGLVGPGISAELWPTREEFLKRLIEYGRCRKKITPEDAGFFQEEDDRFYLHTIHQLRKKIGEADFSAFIKRTFDNKISSQTDARFTVAQKALMQLPIQNYLTLCYDGGLTNARSYLHPTAHTSYYFWDQREVMDIYETEGFERLILHAHGRYDRSSSLVLDIEDCRLAYQSSFFTKLLRDLFMHKRLIIVGFEPNCPYMTRLLDAVTSDGKKSSVKHIAFIGLDEDKVQMTDRIRKREETNYRALILFYPRRNGYETMVAWLTALAEKFSNLSTDSVRNEEEKQKEIPPSEKASITIEQFISRLPIPPRSDPELSKEQKIDYETFGYNCYDTVYIPGTAPADRTNILLINDYEIPIGDKSFILFLRFVVELKKGNGGWVHISSLQENGIKIEIGEYQIFSNLRTVVRGSLLIKKDGGKKFIQNDKSSRYRISTHPDFVTYNKENLLNHEDGRVRKLAQELP